MYSWVLQLVDKWPSFRGNLGKFGFEAIIAAKITDNCNCLYIWSCLRPLGNDQVGSLTVLLHLFRQTLCLTSTT